MTTTRLLASTVALLGALSALSGDLAAAFEGKVLHVSDSGLKSFVFDAHSRLLRVTFKGGNFLIVLRTQRIKEVINHCTLYYDFCCYKIYNLCCWCYNKYLIVTKLVMKIHFYFEARNSSFLVLNLIN